MKSFNFFLLIILLVNIFACKDDDCHVSITYENHVVDFYNTHKDFDLIPAKFETVTEQYLWKETHQEGATFEILEEEFLLHEAYTIYHIMDSTVFHIVSNSKIDSVARIACYNFFEESDFVETEVPAEYITLTKRQVVEQGTGAQIPAIYRTHTSKRVNHDAIFRPSTTNRKFQRVVFKIPEGRTIRAHLGHSFEQHSIQDCAEGNSYKIHE